MSRLRSVSVFRGSSVNFQYVRSLTRPRMFSWSAPSVDMAESLPECRWGGNLFTAAEAAHGEGVAIPKDHCCLP